MARAPARKLFGSERRTEVLLLIALLRETFPTEIARLLGAPVYSVQKIVGGLEKDGVVVTRLAKRTRVVALDPGFAASRQLKNLLTRLIEVNPKIRSIAVRRRARQGRRGKAIT